MGKDQQSSRSDVDAVQLAKSLGLPIAEELPPDERVEGERAVLRAADGAVGEWVRDGRTGELVLMLRGDGATVPEAQPERIERARERAQQLGLPFTPDMTMNDVTEGTRAVDALGRVGAFIEGDNRMLMFRPSSSPQEAGELFAALRREAAREPRYYEEPLWPRNGREVGAWTAGVAREVRKLQVRMIEEHVDGAVTCLVAAGMVVGRRSAEGGLVTLDVECPDGLGDDGTPRGVIREVPGEEEQT